MLPVDTFIRHNRRTAWVSREVLPFADGDRVMDGRTCRDDFRIDYLPGEDEIGSEFPNSQFPWIDSNGKAGH